jgi:hypothetical protein
MRSEIPEAASRLKIGHYSALNAFDDRTAATIAEKNNV